MEFSRALQGIEALRDIIGVQVDGSTLTPLEFQSERGHPVLEITNRYFTAEREATGQDAVTLGPAVDPLGILAAFGKEQGGLHLQDNTVEYYEQRVDGKG